MADLVVPQLGESLSEAVVSRWLKNVGDAVTVDEPVAELETDKITVQLPSPVAGALSEQRFAAGATVKVGDVIGAAAAGARRRTGRAPDRTAGATAHRGDRAAEPADPADEDERPRRCRDRPRSALEAHAVAARNRARDWCSAAWQRCERTGCARRALRRRAARPGRSARRGRADVSASQARRLAPVPVPARCCVAHDVHLVRHDRGDGDAREVQGRLREGARREARFHVVFRLGVCRRMQAVPGRQRRGDRRQHRLQEALRLRHRGPGAEGPRRARAPRLRCALVRRCREGHRRARGEVAQRQARAAGSPGRHVLDHERRHLRLDDVDAAAELSADRHPRHAQHRQARRRDRRCGPGPADDVRRVVVRPSRRRRPRGRVVPRRGQGPARVARAHARRSVAVSYEEFLAWRTPRFGDANPTRMDNPLWTSLVHDRINAWQVNQQYGFARACGAGPTWCFDRFGQSTTVLADGRTIYIAGEHEDYYDPDFCIYNDVVVVAPNGDVAIFGYPREVFPPTDFDSATLFGGGIVIVGSLGYHDERRAGTTPVYRLDLATKAIEPIATTGDPPGWIHRHAATLEGTKLIVSGGMFQTADTLEDNIDEWALDLATSRWKRLTKKDW